jgi:predicted TPR repeat methyltransferase
MRKNVDVSGGPRPQEGHNSAMPFTQYAAYYDLLYQNKDYKAETLFVSKLIQKLNTANPDKISILDLACGTGRHAMEFRKLGYKIEGSDISRDMITVAVEESTKRGLSIPFYNESFQTCGRIGNKYHFVLAMFSAINYLTEYSDLSRALANISSLLHEDGFFIFDCWNGNAVIRDFSPTRVKRMAREGKEVIRISETTLDQVAQIAKVDFHFLLSENNVIIGEFDEVHRIRYFFLQELVDLLHANGLEVVTRCPFMHSETDVTASDWNVTHIVRKAR